MAKSTSCVKCAARSVRMLVTLFYILLCLEISTSIVTLYFQYTCGQEDFAGPPGCLQYLTATTGLIKKYKKTLYLSLYLEYSFIISVLDTLQAILLLQHPQLLPIWATRITRFAFVVQQVTVTFATLPGTVFKPQPVLELVLLLLTMTKLPKIVPASLIISLFLKEPPPPLLQPPLQLKELNGIVAGNLALLLTMIPLLSAHAFIPSVWGWRLMPMKYARPKLLWLVNSIWLLPVCLAVSLGSH